MKTLLVSLSMLVVLILTLTSRGPSDAYIYQKLHRSLVHLGSETVSGSGSIVLGLKSHDPYVLTAAHVCAKAVQIAIMDYETNPVSNPIYSKTADICVLSAKGFKSKLVPLSLGKDAEDFETLYTMGYPEGLLKAQSGPYTGPFVLIAGPTDTWWPEDKQIFTIVPPPGLFMIKKSPLRQESFSVVSGPGASGSPVVNNYGQLLGVVSHSHVITTITYVDDIKALLKDL